MADSGKDRVGRAIFQSQKVPGDCFKTATNIPCTQNGLSGKSKVNLTNTPGMDKPLSDDVKYQIPVYLFNIVKEATVIIVVIPLSVAVHDYRENVELKNTFQSLRKNIYPLKAAANNMLFVLTDEEKIVDKAYIKNYQDNISGNLNNALSATVGAWPWTKLPKVPVLFFNEHQPLLWLIDGFLDVLPLFQAKQPYKFYPTVVFSYNYLDNQVNVLLIITGTILALAITAIIIMALTFFIKRWLSREGKRTNDLELEVP